MSRLEMMADLQANWQSLMQLIGADAKRARQVFTFVLTQYSKIGRRYHNLDHLHDVLQTIARMREHAQDVHTIQLAAWFHDLVYEPARKDNEERSAALARRILEDLKVGEAIIGTVERLVLATRCHEAAAEDSDCRILLDADLAVLAADPNTYQRYTQAIRQEYAHVEEEAYRNGRRHLLQRFLDRDRIFLTDEMYRQHEAQARQNIRRELASLEP